MCDMKEQQVDGANTPIDNNSDKIVENEETGIEESPNETATTTEEATESEVEKLTGELTEIKDKHLRLYSEFENYRRRTAKERLELIGSANADLMTSLLPILDDFERAREAAEKSNSSAEFEGMNLIYQKLLKELKSKGLKPMENLEGEKFDAEVHEAISQTPAPKKKLKNRIVHVVERGYYLNDKVIRYAKVVIGT
ncbi:MAG: protein GrpE [Cyclobacteriaceae bacterium]|nr:MAG: protein GrpE [Cyclobacteriaceae bacterium]